MLPKKSAEEAGLRTRPIGAVRIPFWFLSGYSLAASGRLLCKFHGQELSEGLSGNSSLRSLYTALSLAERIGSIAPCSVERVPNATIRQPHIKRATAMTHEGSIRAVSVEERKQAHPSRA